MPDFVATARMFGGTARIRLIRQSTKPLTSHRGLRERPPTLKGNSMSTPIKWGTEFLANTTTAGNQFQNITAGLTNGRFVVAWLDDSATGIDQAGTAVRGQIFNADGSKAGAEFAINTD